MTTSKYWVPALERADSILKAIASSPSSLKLMELSHETGINKSSMFSLLHTLESLGWVEKRQGDTYSLGSTFASMGNAYFSGMSLIEEFMAAAAETTASIKETVQLAKLDKQEIVYLAKKESSSPIRLVSGPGMRLPAYATAMGKVLLSYMTDEEIRSLYPQAFLEKLTAKTVETTKQLLDQIRSIRKQKYSLDLEEAITGFCCVAAPILSDQGTPVAAVSISMLTQHWEEKQEAALDEIRALAKKLTSANRWVNA
jgi:DNA-binding IclR family transcriptional regulator